MQGGFGRVRGVEQCLVGSAPYLSELLPRGAQYFTRNTDVEEVSSRTLTNLKMRYY